MSAVNPLPAAATMPPSLRIECSEQRVLKGAVLLGLAQVVVHPVLLSASCPPRFDSSLYASPTQTRGGANSAVVTGVNTLLIARSVTAC